MTYREVSLVCSFLVGITLLCKLFIGSDDDDDGDYYYTDGDDDNESILPTVS